MSVVELPAISLFWKQLRNSFYREWHIFNLMHMNIIYSEVQWKKGILAQIVAMSL